MSWASWAVYVVVATPGVLMLVVLTLEWLDRRKARAAAEQARLMSEAWWDKRCEIETLEDLWKKS